MTANEEILKQSIIDLTLQVQDMNTYMNMLQQTLSNQIHDNCENVVTMPFCAQQTWYVTLPFSVNSCSCSVDVYVEEGCGVYRRASPALSFAGMSVSVDFDAARSGYVVVTNLFGSSQPNYIPPAPGPFYLPEPALIDSIEDPVADHQALDGLSDDDIPNYIEEPTIEDHNYERAMKVIE